MAYFDAVFNREEFIAIKVVTYVEKTLNKFGAGTVIKVLTSVVFFNGKRPI